MDWYNVVYEPQFLLPLILITGLASSSHWLSGRCGISNLYGRVPTPEGRNWPVRDLGRHELAGNQPESCHSDSLVVRSGLDPCGRSLFGDGEYK